MDDSRPWWQHLIASLLLFGLFAQLVLSVDHKSATWDEQFHILNGVAWFRADRQRPIVGNPPLVNILETVPLVALEDVRLPTDSPLWSGTRWLEISQQFLWEINGENALRLVFLARLVVIGLTLLLATGVYRWARELSGPTAGLLALLLFAFDPNILAHGRLATTDLGIACFALWAAYLFWRYRMRSSWRRSALVSLALGAALTAKFSGALLLPAFLSLSMLPAESMRCRGWFTRVWRSLAGFGGILGIAALVLLAAYRFSVTTLLAEYNWQRLHFEGGHPAFLMGQHSNVGWWYYFPVAFALKTPIPLVVLVAAGLVGMSHRKRDLAFLLLPPLAIFGVSLLSRVNIGYRYLLPVLPFLFILAGGVSSFSSPFAHRAKRAACYALCAGLLGWYLLGGLRIFPHYLAYFNELAGGPENGWRYLVDSNVDWGQDLPGLRAYMKAQGLEQVNLSWFSSVPPESYGVDYVPLPSWPPFAAEPWHRVYHPQRPLSGIYAISATHLQGVYLPDRDTYAWFRERQPAAKIGYSIFVYNVSPSGGEPVSVCLSGMSIDQVDAQTLDAALGTNDLSLRWFDARGAVVLPSAERDTWYLLADATTLDPALEVWFFPSGSVWGRRQTADGSRQYTLYHLSADRVTRLIASIVASKAPIWWSPAAAFPSGYERHPLSLPVDFGHQLAFLGYELGTNRLHPGGELVLLTFWRVEQPFEPPLALFVHLLSADGQVYGQHDGLSVEPVGLEAGDVFVQVHRLSVPSDTPPGEYQLEIGVYQPSTMQRWVVYEGADEVANRLLLPLVSIEAP